MNATPSHTCNAQHNQLLATLSDADWDCWRPHLEPVDLALGQVVRGSGCSPKYLLFPTTAIVSLMYLTQGGGSSEIAVVGNDGVVGISLFMGGDATPSHAVVQRPGQGYRLLARQATYEVSRSGQALHMLLSYALRMIAQVAQTAACNRHHSIDQQFCRRLLLSLDRSPSNELQMTQELVANLLGVRREGVTAAALKLQKAGAIRYSRGHIVVLDRRQLEKCACECYAVAKKDYAPLLPMPLAA